MGILGILLGLSLLIVLAFRGWSILLLAPASALAAALIVGEPLLANWTQTFMGSAAHFLAQFFPLFLLGALFGKLMDDSGSVSVIADFMTQKLGTKHAILAVVLADELGIETNNSALIRIVNTDTQTHKSRAERAQNMDGAFKLLDQVSLSGKHILLLDDVLTTGATIEACVSALQSAKEIKISIVTLGIAID